MTATTNHTERGAPASPPSLDFDVIDARVREILNLPKDARLFDSDVAGVVGSSRESISRYRNGRMVPLLETAGDIAAALDLSLDDIKPKATAGAAA